MLCWSDKISNFVNQVKSSIFILIIYHFKNEIVNRKITEARQFSIIYKSNTNQLCISLIKGQKPIITSWKFLLVDLNIYEISHPNLHLYIPLSVLLKLLTNSFHSPFLIKSSFIGLRIAAHHLNTLTFFLYKLEREIEELSPESFVLLLNSCCKLPKSCSLI